MKKLFIQSFGCQMSVADGEEMARPLLKRGFSVVSDLREADAAILNTCTVRQHAEDRALSFIGRLLPWKEERPERFLIVAGCAAERIGDRLQRRFPHIDLVVGAKSIEQYPEILDQALRNRFDGTRENREAWRGNEISAEFPQGSAIADPTPGTSPAAASPGVSSFVTVMRGCNYTCTYCIVPSVRGRELYRPLDAILGEIREKIEAGAREIILLGQTVNSYRFNGLDFADLLRQAGRMEGLLRLRFMSPHPYFLNDRMIEAIAENPKICRHLHLPLQSGSNSVLKRMRRNYSAEEFLEKAGKLRRAVPGMAFTTDVIAGFPGETEEDFQATLRALDALDPCSAYCFKFSPRPGTEAAEFLDSLPEPVREERLRRLLTAVEARMQKHLDRYIGQDVGVLLEDSQYGRIEHYFPARTEEPRKIGEFLRGTVVSASQTGLKIRVPPASHSSNGAIHPSSL